MPLGRPDRDEPVFIGEFGPVEQQFVFIAPHSVVIAPVKQAEVHPFGTDRGPGDQGAGFVARHDHGEPAGDGPEQFQHRNVKRQAGHSQPDGTG